MGIHRKLWLSFTYCGESKRIIIFISQEMNAHFIICIPRSERIMHTLRDLINLWSLNSVSWVLSVWSLFTRKLSRHFWYNIWNGIPGNNGKACIIQPTLFIGHWWERINSAKKCYKRHTQYISVWLTSNDVPTTSQGRSQAKTYNPNNNKLKIIQVIGQWIFEQAMMLNLAR